jgi:hypothetical protein
MNIPRIYGIAVFAAVFHASVLAQIRPQDGYLENLRRAEKAAAQLPESAFANENPRSVGPAARVLDELGIIQSFTGDVDGAISTFDRMHRLRHFPVGRGEETQMSLVADASAEDAIKAIVEEARHRRVVLLNEAHHVPLHRAFAQKLAAALREIGYDYLACETFPAETGAVPLGANGEVIYRTGYYLQDPVFAGFINSAAADKWKFVAYESRGASMEERERGQAQNLVERIFAKDKNAKVFIYVGYGHLSKTPEGKGGPLMMGEYLRRMTGLDMLHVQQTDFFAHPDRAEEGQLYQLLLDKFPSKEPIVLRASDGSHPILRGQKGRIDMQVIFPRYGMREGRPEWLLSLAGREARDIPVQLLPASGRRAIKAYRKDDGPDAVPADIVVVKAGAPVPKLMLPKGEYRYATED